MNTEEKFDVFEKNGLIEINANNIFYESIKNEKDAYKKEEIYYTARRDIFLEVLRYIENHKYEKAVINICNWLFCLNHNYTNNYENIESCGLESFPTIFKNPEAIYFMDELARDDDGVFCYLQDNLIGEPIVEQIAKKNFKIS